MFVSILDCPAGFSAHDGSCYWVRDVEANWFQARDFCAANGGYVVKIDSADEQTLVYNLGGWGTDLSQIWETKALTHGLVLVTK